jgi:hypothetical protein
LNEVVEKETLAVPGCARYEDKKRRFVDDFLGVSREIDSVILPDNHKAGLGLAGGQLTEKHPRNAHPAK